MEQEYNEQEYNYPGQQIVKKITFKGNFQDLISICDSLTIDLNIRIPDERNEFRLKTESAKRLEVVFSFDIQTGVGGWIIAHQGLGNSLELRGIYDPDWPQLEHLWTLFEDELKQRNLVEIYPRQQIDGKETIVTSQPESAASTTKQHVEYHFHGPVTGSAIGDSTLNAQNIAGRDIVDQDTAVTNPPDTQQEIQSNRKVIIKRAEFLKQLGGAFNKKDLKSLCFNLSVKYDSLAGETLDEIFISLIEKFERENRIEELLEVCKQERPRLNWDGFVSS